MLDVSCTIEQINLIFISILAIFITRISQLKEFLLTGQKIKLNYANTPGLILINNNHFVIEISKYRHKYIPFFTPLTHAYTNYNDPLTLHVHVPNRTIDLLKVQRMYASIEIYEEYLTENRLLHDSATACAVFLDAG